ncbi:DUF5110 domain-containing protein [Tunturiibacter lichenicola]|uniref:DUF5110 domain-containing protein n=1 Tax=Tunturiibacter lichenicola TaxID=2051959 RepID=UPI003D9B17D3
MYQDDGISFAYQEKDFLRVKHSCESADGGLRLRPGAREGSFQPWWNDVEVTVFDLEVCAGKDYLRRRGDFEVPF